MSPGKKKKNLLAHVNFPLYSIQMLTNRHVLLAGGGGSSKTGVSNGFVICDIYHNGRKIVAEKILRHETGPNCVMNCATYSDAKHTYLVAGQENHSQLYLVKTELPTETTNGTVRQRRKGSNNKNGLKFVIQPADSIQTDFGPGPIQRVVRISPNGKFMASGGTDGIVRLWGFPSLKPKFNLIAHSQEIDDIDFCPVTNYLVTVAKDGLAIVWNYTNGREMTRLTWTQPKDTQYLFKRCKFGRIENEKKSALFMIANPVTKNKSYLQQWRPGDGLKKAVKFQENLSALAVQDTGIYLAVGTMTEGSVYIYVSFSLQLALHIPRVHSMFVTGLEFVPVDNHTVSKATEAAVISISVDNKVCIHSVPVRRTVSAYVFIAIIMLLIFCTFAICSYVFDSKRSIRYKK